MENNQNTAKHFIKNSISNLEMLSGSFTTHKFKPHFHESYTIIFVEDGIGDYSCFKSNYITPSGSILVLNPYEVHAGQSLDGSPWNFITMYIPQNIMRSAMFNLTGKNELPLFAENTVTNLNLFKEGLSVFSDLLMNKDEVESQSCLMQFLRNLIQGYACEADRGQLSNQGFIMAHKIREYLHEHFLEDVSLQRLSTIFGTAEYNLVKIFKRYFQLPPHQYLLNLRIENSKRLLLQHYSSTEAAYQSGFFDQSHFIRHFKKIIGITPGQFANKGF